MIEKSSGKARKDLKTNEIGTGNIVFALAIPVVKEGVLSDEDVYFTISSRIATSGQTTEFTSVEAPHLDGSDADIINTGSNTTYSFTGIFSPHDPVNETFSRLGWNGASNIEAKMLVVMAQDRFIKIKDDGTADVGTYEAEIVSVNFTPKPPAIGSDSLIAVDVEMSKQGSSNKTWATVNVETERWEPTGDKRTPSEYKIWMDSNGDISFHPPVAQPETSRVTRKEFI
jgi:hypothetical protein